jgi:serine/threonine-protein kinase
MPNTVAERRRVTFVSALVQSIILGMFVAAALIARHNWRKGRGDRRGAWQLAAFVSLTAAGVWALDSRHVADPSLEMTRFFVGQPLWAAGLLWILYLAVEPYVRRFWPSTLVSWSRLMSRQWRDPLVGRDVLFGVAIGLAVHVLSASTTYVAARLGHAWTPDTPDLQELLGNSMDIARNLNHVFNAVLNAIFSVFAMVLLKMAVKREWLASLVAIALVTLLFSQNSGSAPTAIDYAALLIIVTIVVLTIQRLGLVATTVAFFMMYAMAAGVVTLDTSRWFFSDSVVQLLIAGSLAAYGFYASRGGEPLLGTRLLD